MSSHNTIRKQLYLPVDISEWLDREALGGPRVNDIIVSALYSYKDSIKESVENSDENIEKKMKRIINKILKSKGIT